MHPQESGESTVALCSRYNGEPSLPSSSCSREGLVPALEAELLEWREWLEALGDGLGLLVPELSEKRPDDSRNSESWVRSLCGWKGSCCCFRS